jgi:hypothetical protein
MVKTRVQNKKQNYMSGDKQQEFGFGWASHEIAKPTRFRGVNLFTSTRIPKSPVEFVSQRKQYNENIPITLKMTKELNTQKPNCASNLQHPYEKARDFFGVPAVMYTVLSRFCSIVGFLGFKS